jgi:hypothetical protein
MKNILILSRNYKDYVSGPYYQDLIDAFLAKHNVFLYGPGYDNYCQDDDFKDVLIKSEDSISSVDLIVVSNSWGDENPANPIFDVHPNICLSDINIPCVYFLNKEYKKLTQKLAYIKKNNFNITFTVYKEHKEWSGKTGCLFKTMPFGVNLDVFKPLDIRKIYDFSFMGALHRNYGVESRYEIKKIIFKPKYLNNLSSKKNWVYKSPLNKKYQKYNVYWAEWGAKSFFNKPLTLSGDKYVVLLNQTKTFFNSLSAEGIFNCRFFELMATKTLIFCPKSVESYGILFDGVNAVMFNDDFSDLEEKFQLLIGGKIDTKRIIEQAFRDVQNYSYNDVVTKVINYTGLLE